MLFPCQASRRLTPPSEVVGYPRKPPRSHHFTGGAGGAGGAGCAAGAGGGRPASDHRAPDTRSAMAFTSIRACARPPPDARPPLDARANRPRRDTTTAHTLASPLDSEPRLRNPLLQFWAGGTRDTEPDVVVGVVGVVVVTVRRPAVVGVVVPAAAAQQTVRVNVGVMPRRRYSRCPARSQPGPARCG